MDQCSYSLMSIFRVSQLRRLLLLLAAAVVFRCTLQATRPPDYVLDVIRDLPPVEPNGRYHSVVATVHDVLHDGPQVELSSFVDIGCVVLNSEAAIKALASCILIKGLGGSRIPCTSNCTSLAAELVPGASASALLRGSACWCCTTDAALNAAARASHASCDWPCAEQEEAIYGTSAFEAQKHEPWACGGRTEHTFSAFRQFDGVSPLGRRGAFGGKFSTWYQAVVLELPQNLRELHDFWQERWMVYQPFSHFLHAVHVDLGWPVFAHQVPLPFAPECLHMDGLRERLVALVRTRAGGLDAVAICPGCWRANPSKNTHIEVIPALNASDGPASVAAMPACTFDAERAVLAFVAVSAAGSESEAQLVEVDVARKVISQRSADSLAKAVALEPCRHMGERQRHLSALLVSPGGLGGEFLLASAEALAEENMPAETLPQCGPNVTMQCASTIGADLPMVQFTGSASHASLPFVFFPMEDAVGSSNTRLAQLRCDGTGEDAFLWPSSTPSYHRRRSALLEAPFNRRGGTGHPVQAPRLVRAEFSTSGREIIALFDKATLMGVAPQDTDGDGLYDIHEEADAWPHIFGCNRIVADDVLRAFLLQNATCSWATSRTLVVRVGVDSPIDVGDPFYVRAGIVYGYEPYVGYSSPATGGVFLVGPSNVRPPQLQVFGSRLVDHCSTVELDASSSQAVKPIFGWTLLQGACRQSDCNLTMVASKVAAANDSSAEVLRLEAADRPSDLELLELEIYVWSRWGLNDSGLVVVRFDLDSFRPTLSVRSVPTSTTVPSVGGAVQGHALQSSCYTTKLKFQWKLMAIHPLPMARTDASAAALVSRAYDRWDADLITGWMSSSLLLPPHAIAAGVSYEFKLTVGPASSIGLTNYTASAKANLSVEPSAMHIRFVQPLVVMRLEDVAELDVTPSFDPDAPEDVLPQPEWRCRSITAGACKADFTAELEAGPPMCIFKYPQALSLDDVDWEATSASQNASARLLACRLRPLALAFRGQAFSKDGVARVVAELQADIVSPQDRWWVAPGLWSRSSQAVAEVSIRDDTSPQAGVDASARRLANTSAALIAWVSRLHDEALPAHKPLRLEGFCNRKNSTNEAGLADISYNWVVERLELNPTYDFERAVLEGAEYEIRVPKFLFAPVLGQVPLRYATSLGTSLALAPYTLTAGARYRFVLHASDGFDSVVAAQEVDVVRSRPLLGRVSVSPLAGITGDTEFELVCRDWAAEENMLPLTYDFGYVLDHIKSGNPAEVRLGLPTPSAVLRTRFLGGDFAEGPVQVFVDVYTTLGGSRRGITYAYVSTRIGPADALSRELRDVEQGDPLWASTRIPALLVQHVATAAHHDSIADDVNASNISMGSRQSAEVQAVNQQHGAFALDALRIWRDAWSTLARRAGADRKAVWDPPMLGIVLVALTQALRVICGHLSAYQARRDAAFAFEELLMDALPNAELAGLARVAPERFPIPIVHPDAKLPTAFIEGIADILFLPATVRQPYDSSDILTEGDIATSTSHLLGLLERMYGVLVQSLAPGEPFQVIMPGFHFLCGRSVDMSQAAHVLAPVEAGFPADVLTTSAWLYVSVNLLSVLGYPPGLPATGVVRTEVGAPQQSNQLPMVAFVAVGGSPDDLLGLVLLRPAWVSAFGATWRGSPQPPAASCFQWLDNGTWTHVDVVADEGGGCRTPLPTGRSSALLGLFLDELPLRKELHPGDDALLEPPPEGGPARMAVAMSSVGTLLFVNVGTVIVLRICRNKLGSPSAVLPVAPADWPVRPGYRVARVVEDPLVYGGSQELERPRWLRSCCSRASSGTYPLHQPSGQGVLWMRSWIRVSSHSHLIFGLASADHKVTMQHKAATLFAVLAAACGLTALLSERARLLPLTCAGLAGVLSWPLGLLIHLLYDRRPWLPPRQASDEAAQDMWEDAESSLRHLEGRAEALNHHERTFRVLCDVVPRPSGAPRSQASSPSSSVAPSSPVAPWPSLPVPAWQGASPSVTEQGHQDPSPAGRARMLRSATLPRPRSAPRRRRPPVAPADAAESERIFEPVLSSVVASSSDRVKASNKALQPMPQLPPKLRRELRRVAGSSSSTSIAGRLVPPPPLAPLHLDQQRIVGSVLLQAESASSESSTLHEHPALHDGLTASSMSSSRGPEDDNKAAISPSDSRRPSPPAPRNLVMKQARTSSSSLGAFREEPAVLSGSLRHRHAALSPRGGHRAAAVPRNPASAPVIVAATTSGGWRSSSKMLPSVGTWLTAAPKRLRPLAQTWPPVSRACSSEAMPFGGEILSPKEEGFRALPHELEAVHRCWQMPPPLTLPDPARLGRREELFAHGGLAVQSSKHEEGLPRGVRRKYNLPSVAPHSTATGAERTISHLSQRIRMETPFAAQRFLADLRYEEQSLERIRQQLQEVRAIHTEGLERPYFEEAREDLPDAVATSMLWLAHVASFCVTWAGCFTTSLYSPWLFSSITSFMRFTALVLGAWVTVGALDTMRTGLVTLVELARLETRRRESQAGWSAEHPDLCGTARRARGERVELGSLAKSAAQD